MTPLTLTVAIPSYRRAASLAATLAAITPQVNQNRDLFDATILVVDNDPLGSAATTVHTAAGAVRYVLEPKPGIAAVRNRALSETSSRLLVFIDDDEVPREHWLVIWSRHGNTQRHRGGRSSRIPSSMGTSTPGSSKESSSRERSTRRAPRWR